MDRQPVKTGREWRDSHGSSSLGHGSLYKLIITFCLVNRVLMLDLSGGIVALDTAGFVGEQLASLISQSTSSSSNFHGSTRSSLGNLFAGSDTILQNGGVLDQLRSKCDDTDDEEQDARLPLLLSDLDLSGATLSSAGTGGVHFVPDSSGKFKVVFKPRDEENDSTGGVGFIREYAAHVLDDGFAGVPETTVTALDVGKGPQLGSVQVFVQDSQDAEDFGHGMFSVQDVHRIGVLDIRILNRDRHSGNMMRHNKTGKLVPIDHGAAFPELSSLGDCSFEWLQYPQAKQPFDKATLEAIEAFDIEEDLDKLVLAGLSDGAQLGTWMSTTLLKLGAGRGKTLFEIGSLVQRKGDRSQPSELEKLFARVSEDSSPENFGHLFEKYANELIADL